MTKILAVGDVHGNDRFFKAVCQVAVDEGCEGILQVGDFGYWEHYPEGKTFLWSVERYLEEFGLWGKFLDGNHENHPMLWQKYGYDVTQESQISERLFYLPRGYRWEWNGVSCMAVGGAFSVDKDTRTEGKSWWATETIRDEDVEAAVAPGQVDVIFSHDVPEGAKVPTLAWIAERYPVDPYPQSKENRERLLKIVKATRPKLLVHGHYHDAYRDDLVFSYRRGEDVGWHNTHINGLAADFQWTGSCQVFDFSAMPKLPWWNSGEC